jgi:hypothetical protein
MDKVAEYIVVMLLSVIPYFVVLNINITSKKLRGDPLTKWEKTYDEWKEKSRDR